MFITASVCLFVLHYFSTYKCNSYLCKSWYTKAMMGVYDKKRHRPGGWVDETRWRGREASTP